jgi:ferredoxin
MTEQAHGSSLTPRERFAWRVAQIAVWAVGLGIFLALLVRPTLGIHLFWNVLIPVAPALVVFAPGLWRNICPLGSTALLARHVDRRQRRTLSIETQGVFTLLGVVLLLLIVPLRHVVLDTSGPATAITLGAAGLVAIAVCLVYEWKSAWCSGLCPVHPVEKLYGLNPALTLKNAHCHACHRCVRICPDSTPGMTPLLAPGTRLHLWAGTLMVGGFVGFIWGWFQVPDYADGEGWRHLGAVFGLPMGGMVVSLVLYLVLQRLLGEERQGLLLRVFAAAAVACYYWFRLPALVGFGPFPGDGMLIDMTGSLPVWSVAASRACTTGLFFWWLVARKGVRRSWAMRPPFVEAIKPQGEQGGAVPVACTLRRSPVAE